MNYEHIFDNLEINSEPFALCELRGACDLGLGRDPSTTLHYILAGEGEVFVTGSPPIKVSPGSLVLIPAQQRHSLRSFGGPTVPVPACKPAALNLVHLLHAPEQSDPNMGQLVAICAHVNVGLRGDTNLIDLIREPLVERHNQDGPMKSLLTSLLREVSEPQLGSRAMIRTILLQTMLELLRTRIQKDDPALQWMSALKDTSLWMALRAMLDAPGNPHTVETLAAHVNMSRSAFAKRFSDAYGTGPMELLRDLRLRMAGRLLADTDLPVKRVAEMVGFSSRSAFSRMFEGYTGQSPRAFRQELATRPKQQYPI